MKWLMAILMMSAFCVSADLQLVSADANGELVDGNGDGIFDSVNTASLELVVQNSSARKRAVVFEFTVPGSEKTVEKAELRLRLNGKYGCTGWPEEAGIFGPLCHVFIYAEPNADGKILLSDDGCGKKIGTLLQAVPYASDLQAPLMFDLTSEYTRLVKGGAKRIGIRIEADAKTPGSQNGWRFRSIKFGEQYGKSNIPALIVTFGKGK